VIRHSSGDRIVAIIEIMSPGNKSGRAALESVLDKMISALQAGVHVLAIDLFPPGPFDQEGVHGLLWNALSAKQFVLPPGKRLTLAAYLAGGRLRAFVEPIAVGAPLPDMPLFLDPGHYVNVPLEATYQRAWEGVPRRWRDVIEGNA
jgi:hypothetical protein